MKPRARFLALTYFPRYGLRPGWKVWSDDGVAFYGSTLELAYAAWKRQDTWRGMK